MDRFNCLSSAGPTRPLLSDSAADSLSNAEEGRTLLEKFATDLKKAQSLEQQGDTKNAQKIYSDLFWKADVGKDIENANSPLKTEKPSLAFRHRCIEEVCGNAIADFLIGKIYLEGDAEHKVTKCSRKATESFTKAFSKGYEYAFDVLTFEAKNNKCPEANYQLYHIYSNGTDDLIAKPELAFCFLKNAADFGHVRAQLDIAKKFVDKHVSDFFNKDENLAKAIHYYTLAAKKNPQQAYTELAQFYVKKGTKEDCLEAIKYIKQLNNQKESDNISVAIFDKASTLLQSASKFNSHEAQAKELFLLAANLGLAKANFEIGKIYEARIESGSFLYKEENAKNAFDYYKKAADAKPPHVEATVKVGIFYEKDGKIELAKERYEIAAKRKNVEARARLGDATCAFLHAKKLQQKDPDDQDVIHFYKVAAKEGKTEAFFELGLIYEALSKKVTLLSNLDDYNINEALGHYQSAVNGYPSHAEAALRMAKIYEAKGDTYSARSYYKIADKNGNVEAKARSGDKDAAYQHAQSLERKNKNNADIIQFYTTAANQRHGDAAFWLYQFHNTHTGSNHQMAATKYLDIAVRANHPSALEISEAQQSEVTISKVSEVGLIERLPENDIFNIDSIDPNEQL